MLLLFDRRQTSSPPRRRHGSYVRYTTSTSVHPVNVITVERPGHIVITPFVRSVHYAVRSYDMVRCKTVL